MSTNEPVVFITGANTGLGLEAVKALLAESEGFEILLGTRTLKNGEQAIEGLKSIIASSKSTVTPLQVDVSSDESIEAAFSTISKQFGRLDVLVNNAGVSIPKHRIRARLTCKLGEHRSRYPERHVRQATGL